MANRVVHFDVYADDVERAIAFYQKVFGWTAKTTPMGENAPPYTEFQLDGQSFAGGYEMPEMVPAEVPSHWLVYFTTGDVDAAFRKVTELGGSEMLAPQDFPGGRFAILRDPQGAAFGILKPQPAS